MGPLAAVVFPVGLVLIVGRVAAMPAIVLRSAAVVVAAGAVFFVIDSAVATYLERNNSSRADD